jgi:hypothetical protein
MDAQEQLLGRTPECCGRMDAQEQPVIDDAKVVKRWPKTTSYFAQRCVM